MDVKASVGFGGRRETAALKWLSAPPCRPVPKHLHTPGNNGRYSTIQCRISHSALTSLLRDWSSFVLVEGYSYVKLIHGWVALTWCCVGNRARGQTKDLVRPVCGDGPEADAHRRGWELDRGVWNPAVSELFRCVPGTAQREGEASWGVSAC